jgi:hypothetical protein
VLYFWSAKPSIFIAGADLNALVSLREGDLEEFIGLGSRYSIHLLRSTFRRLPQFMEPVLVVGMK